MTLTNEDVVTGILTQEEILKRQDAPDVFENKQYSTSPIEYDLSLFIKTKKHVPERNRFDSRYIFVK